MTGKRKPRLKLTKKDISLMENVLLCRMVFLDVDSEYYKSCVELVDKLDDFLQRERKANE